MNDVNRQISEKQIPLQPNTSTKLELHAQTEYVLNTSYLPELDGRTVSYKPLFFHFIL